MQSAWMPPESLGLQGHKNCYKPYKTQKQTKTCKRSNLNNILEISLTNFIYKLAFTEKFAQIRQDFALFQNLMFSVSAKEHGNILH